MSSMSRTRALPKVHTTGLSSSIRPGWPLKASAQLATPSPVCSTSWGRRLRHTRAAIPANRRPAGTTRPAKHTSASSWRKPIIWSAKAQCSISVVPKRGSGNPRLATSRPRKKPKPRVSTWWSQRSRTWQEGYQALKPRSTRWSSPQPQSLSSWPGASS